MRHRFEGVAAKAIDSNANGKRHGSAYSVAHSFSKLYGKPLELFFVGVLFAVRFRGLFRVMSGMNCVRPCYMGMVSRLLVLTSLVVLRCFTMMSSRVRMLFLCFLVVFGSFL